MPRPKKTTDYPGYGDEKKKLKRNEKNEIIEWKSDSRDGKELKIYIFNDCCTGLTPTKIKNKYPQFAEYNCSTLSNAIRRNRESFNKQARDRAKGQSSSGCKLFFFYFVLLFCLPLLSDICLALLFPCFLKISLWTTSRIW